MFRERLLDGLQRIIQTGGPQTFGFASFYYLSGGIYKSLAVSRFMDLHTFINHQLQLLLFRIQHQLIDGICSGDKAITHNLCIFIRHFF